MPFLGFGLFGALSGTFVYAPELFPPSVRATGMAVCNSVGRYITALGPLIAGVIAASWFGGDLGMATTCGGRLRTDRRRRPGLRPRDPRRTNCPPIRHPRNDPVQLHREEPVMTELHRSSAPSSSAARSAA